jgi:hypothetical protein
MKLGDTLRLALALALSWPASAAFAQNTPRTASAPDPRASPTLEAARTRWERLTPEEQARARERYEKYLSLSEEERNELAQRAQRIKENGARVQRELSPDVRERLSTLEPAKRHELIKELVEDDAKEKGQRIREMLPDDWLKRLESARPEDRARYLAEFKRRQRERVARFAIDQLGRRLALAPEEIDRLKSLPQDERARSVLELEKRLDEREAKEFGLPPGISQSEWDAWEKLPPEEFFEVMQRYQRARNAHAAPPVSSPNVGGTSVKPPVAVPGGKPDAQPDARSASSGADQQRAPTRANAERNAALRRLAEARRPHPSDFLALAELPKAERALRIERLRRERCMSVIQGGQLLPAERIEELAHASDAKFFETVRRLLGPARTAPPGAHTGADADPPRALPASGTSNETSADGPRRERL